MWMIWLCPPHQESLQRCPSGDNMMVLCDGSNVCNVLTNPCVLPHMYATASFSSTVMTFHIVAGFAWSLRVVLHALKHGDPCRNLLSSDGNITQCSGGPKTHVSAQCSTTEGFLVISFINSL